MSVLKQGAPDLLAYLPGYPEIGAPQNISAIIRSLEKQVASLSARPEELEKAGYANGYATALETAAQVAENTPTTLCQNGDFFSERVAKAIRALASIPSPLRQKMTSGKTVRPIEESDPFSTPGTYEP